MSATLSSALLIKGYVFLAETKRESPWRASSLISVEDHVPRLLEAADHRPGDLVDDQIWNHDTCHQNAQSDDQKHHVECVHVILLRLGSIIGQENIAKRRANAALPGSRLRCRGQDNLVDTGRFFQSTS